MQTFKNMAFWLNTIRSLSKQVGYAVLKMKLYSLASLVIAFFFPLPVYGAGSTRAVDTPQYIRESEAGIAYLLNQLHRGYTRNRLPEEYRSVEVDWQHFLRSRGVLMINKFFVYVFCARLCASPLNPA